MEKYKKIESFLKNIDEIINKKGDENFNEILINEKLNSFKIKNKKDYNYQNIIKFISENISPVNFIKMSNNIVGDIQTTFLDYEYKIQEEKNSNQKLICFSITNFLKNETLKITIESEELINKFYALKIKKIKLIKNTEEFDEEACEIKTIDNIKCLNFLLFFMFYIIDYLNIYEEYSLELLPLKPNKK